MSVYDSAELPVAETPRLKYRLRFFPSGGSPILIRTPRKDMTCDTENTSTGVLNADGLGIECGSGCCFLTAWCTANLVSATFPGSKSCLTKGQL